MRDLLEEQPAIDDGQRARLRTPGAAAESTALRSRAARRHDWRFGQLRLIRASLPQGSDALLTVALMALAIGMLAYLRSAFSIDSWLALVAGRDIWQNGLPFHETLTTIAHGVRWVDQQWLAQLATYALYKLGGLGFLGIVNAALIVAGVAGAVLAARRLGAHPLTVSLLLPLCVWLVLPSREIRTQEFVFPLFALAVYLLAADSRRESRRVYWCLPLLVLWANLHGTASLGAGLVALRGVTLAIDRRRLLLDSAVTWRKPLLLILGAPLCVMLTPYGLHILSYYHATLFNSTLRNAVTEWMPVTSEPSISWPFFALAGIALWSFGRHRSSTTLWERLALLALGAVSITVIRNVSFFGLCALVVVPLSVNEPVVEHVGRREVKVRPRINAIVMAAAAITLLIAIASDLTRPRSQYELGYQRTGVLRAVESATRVDPSAKVFADVRFADWLLWRDPGLRGRVANDARFELLTAAQIDEIRRVFAALGTGWKRAARGYRLIVIDRNAAPEGAQGFLAEPGHRILYDDGQRIVILRSAAEASR